MEASTAGVESSRFLLLFFKWLANKKETVMLLIPLILFFPLLLFSCAVLCVTWIRFLSGISRT
jgi:hypothetical protein